MRQFVAVLADYFAQKHHFAQIVYDNAAFRAILSKYFLAEPLEAQHLDHAQTVRFSEEESAYSTEKVVCSGVR